MSRAHGHQTLEPAGRQPIRYGSRSGHPSTHPYPDPPTTGG
jgi:hypothetical protein